MKKKSKVHILVVDDTWDDAERAKRWLENNDFEVVIADNCETALSIINADPLLYKAVVMDLAIPLTPGEKETYSDGGIRLADKIFKISTGIKFVALTKRLNPEAIKSETSRFSLIFSKQHITGELVAKFTHSVRTLAKTGMVDVHKPPLFVGSSSEAVHIANAIHRNLDSVAEVTVWHQDVFLPSKDILTSLVDRIKRSKFAVFVLAADDLSLIRGKKHLTPRDNVIFETGLAVGILGAGNVFLAVPRGIKDLKLPSDLLGVIYDTYDNNRADRNFTAAMSPFCDRMKLIIEGI